MKKVILISLTFSVLFVKGQMSLEFTNKLYIQDNIGNVDSVLFGNDSLATIGIDTVFYEQNIINIDWDSLEIRSIHRTSDSTDCPINYYGSGYIFQENMDLKRDMRTSVFSESSIFYVFKIHATHFPIEIFSDFTEMFSNSPYNGWTLIFKHHYECDYDEIALCQPNYQYLFTINDSTERYVSIRFDFESSYEDYSFDRNNLFLRNPVIDFIDLDYEGRIQIFDLGGRLLLDCNKSKNEYLNVGYFKSGFYLIKTSNGTIKMIKG